MLKLNSHIVQPTIFPDGTSQVWHLPEPVLQSTHHRVEWVFEEEREFLWLAQLRVLLGHGQPVTLFIRYLPYARQDKTISNDTTFALLTFANLLNALAFGEVIVCDPHSVVALGAIVRSVPVYFTAETAEAFKATLSDVVCYPDAGAVKKYTRVHDLPYVTAEKQRDPATGAISGTKVLGDVVGKRVLIVDDICDGGATFIGLSKALHEAGAEVSLFVSHGLFTRGLEPLFDAGISRIFTPEKEHFRP